MPSSYGLFCLVVNLKHLSPQEKTRKKSKNIPNISLLCLENSSAKFGNNLIGKNPWLEQGHHIINTTLTQVRSIIIALQALAKSGIYQAEHVTKKTVQNTFLSRKEGWQEGRREDN